MNRELYVMYSPGKNRLFLMYIRTDECFIKFYGDKRRSRFMYIGDL